MNQKFHVEVTQRDDVTYIKLAGVIDEDNELGSLVDRLGAGTSVIDLAEIERINSCGVRDWVNWLGRAEKKGAEMILVECSPAIVAQINLVNNFVGNGAVKSFYAPYFCPSCDLEKVLLVDMEEMAGQDRPKAPVCRCDECDGVMDFDDMEESYFAFIQTTKKAQLSTEVKSAMADLVPEESTGERKVRSRVSNVGSGSGSGVSSAGTGSGSGSMPSSVSLPSLPSVPSLPSLSSITGVEPSRPNAKGTTQRPAATGSATGTNITMIVVIVLLLLAIGLLVYVIVSGNQQQAQADRGVGQEPSSHRVAPPPPAYRAEPAPSRRTVLNPRPPGVPC
jgi:anti-anti-sigma regulatory factor